MNDIVLNNVDIDIGLLESTIQQHDVIINSINQGEEEEEEEEEENHNHNQIDDATELTKTATNSNNHIVESSSISSSSMSEIKIDEVAVEMSTRPPPPPAPPEDFSSVLSVAATAAQTPMLNLREILQLFNCSVSQEQAWAVLYQALTKLKHLLDTDLALVKANQPRIDINALNFAKDGTMFFDFQEASKRKDEEDEDDESHASSSSTSSNKHAAIDHEKEQERVLVESKVLKSVAYLIFDALDYGNNYMNEPVLQSSLSHLLLLMSGHYKEYTNSKTVSEDDEGYEQEEEDSIGIDKAIEICNNNLAEADIHCKAVCRGLYAQAYELKVFLAKIEDSKIILQKSGKDPTHYCFEVLDKTDWAKLWMQVIQELRHGVKLRKVSTINGSGGTVATSSEGSGSRTSPIKSTRRNIEYELTPFEILLDQIRARRYHLKKVSLEKNSIGAAIKKDARDIILDFIRSRPPLKKSSQRKLNRTASSSLLGSHNKSQPVNLHEQLMVSIRNYSTPLRRVETQLKKNTTMATTSSGDQVEVEIKKKKLIKVDKKLLNNLTNNSSDDDESEIDEEEIKNLPMLQDLNEVAENSIGGGLIPGELSSIYYSAQQSALNFSVAGGANNQSLTSSLLLMNNSAWNHHHNHNHHFNRSLHNHHLQRQQSRKRIKAPESLKSPLTPWCDPVENWKAFVTDEDMLSDIPDSSPTSKVPPRRHTMTFADLNRLSSTLSSLNIFSSASKKQQHQQRLQNNKAKQIDEEEMGGENSLNSSTSGDQNNEEKLTGSKQKVNETTNTTSPSNNGGVNSSNSSNKTECLKLTFDELCHIRNVLTKAELDYLLFDNHLFNEVQRGKICFACRKTKFNLFSWGHKCRICQQKICKKCLRSVQLKNGCLSAHVPLFKLQPSSSTSTSTNQATQVVSSPDKYKTMRVVESCYADEDFEVLSISSAASNLSNGTTTAANMSSSHPIIGDNVSTSSSSSFSIRSTTHNHNHNHNQPTMTITTFDVCIDCFQMMEGVVVSVDERHLAMNNSLSTSNYRNATSPNTSGRATMSQNQKQQHQTLAVMTDSMGTATSGDECCLASPSSTSLKSNDDVISIHNMKAHFHHKKTHLHHLHHHHQSTPNQNELKLMKRGVIDQDLSTIDKAAVAMSSKPEEGTTSSGLSPSSSSSSSTSSYVDLTAEAAPVKPNRDELSLNLQPVYDANNSSSLLIVDSSNNHH